MKILSQPLKTISVMTLFFFCWTLLPLYSLSAWAGEEKQEPVKNQQQEKERPEERFTKAVEDINNKVSKVAEKASKGEDTTSEIESLRISKADVESLDSEIKKEFSSTEKKLKEANLPKEILDRHYKFVKHYEDNLKDLSANLAAIETAKTKADIKSYAAKAKEHLERVRPPKRHTPLDPNKLPHRTFKAKERQPRLKKEEFEKEFGPENKSSKLLAINYRQGITDFYNQPSKPLLLATNGIPTGMVSELPTYQSENTVLAFNATDDLPTADDLAETPEVQFTQDIKDLAAQLDHNPVKLYEWVRNNIEYEPYYGSFKGANQTLIEGAGNDFDQASLLIALLRVSDIAAKYAYGAIEIPIDKVMDWVGGVTDPKIAGAILATKGIPAKLIISGSVVKAIQMEHVWVEAWIDYIPSWGARHKPGQEDTWIPLDPSFKQYIYKKGMDMYAQMGFTAEQFLQEYITDIRDITSYQDYGMRLVNFVDSNYPDATIEDVFGASEIHLAKTIVKQEFPYLLGTLPYKVIVKGAQFNEIPASKDYTVTIQIEGDTWDGTAGITYSGKLNEVASKRITVSYEPATTSDEALIAQYGGNMLSVPPYLLNTQPVLRVNGTIIATGGPIGLGKDQSIIISFSGPDGDTDRIQNIITAGNYSAIILQSQDTPLTTSSDNMNNLIENSKKADAPDITLDDLLGQMLYSIGVSYFHHLTFENEVYAKTLQLINLRQPSEAMVTHGVKVNYLFGLPRSVSEGGINIDVDRNVNSVFPFTQDMERGNSYMILSGLSSSVWENRILEAFFGVHSVSAVRLLKLASEQGIPIYTITAANMNDIFPLLQIGADVKTDIANAVNAGKKVIVSKTNVTYNQWVGAGYIIMDPVTGAAGYMISGGLAGGESGLLPVSLRRTPQFTYDYWRTFLIRNRALKYARAYIGTPYIWGGKEAIPGFDCSGLVHDLYQDVDSSFPEGNARTQYNYCSVKGWLRPFNERLEGEIIWRSDLGHVGIEAGINEITWPLTSSTTFKGETVVHASGRPCYRSAASAPQRTPSRCIFDACVLIDEEHPEWGGNPSCGNFNQVIESPMNVFATEKKESVCSPR